MSVGEGERSSWRDSAMLLKDSISSGLAVDLLHP